MSQELIERLRMEAQIHAQEARTANSTIAEIYQLCSGGKGEPGNWHGAEPVRALIAERDALLATLRQSADSGRVGDEESLRATAQALREHASMCQNEHARNDLNGYADSIEDALAAQGQGEPWGYVGDHELLKMSQGRAAQVLAKPLPELGITTPVYLTHPAPAASPAGVPDGLQSAVREAAEVLQMVADSGVTLPPNWRWPLADELSGFAYMLMDAAAPSAPEGDGGEG